MYIPLHSIRRDSQLQARAGGIDPEHVARLVEVLRDGGLLPPVLAFADEDGYWLADGWHRVAATEQVGHDEIDADVQPGGRRAAFVRALGANASHGLPRTRDDKRRAVDLALHDAELVALPDREIARITATSHTFVAQRRALLRTAPKPTSAPQRTAEVAPAQPASVTAPAPTLAQLRDKVEGLLTTLVRLGRDTFDLSEEPGQDIGCWLDGVGELTADEIARALPALERDVAQARADYQHRALAEEAERPGASVVRIVETLAVDEADDEDAMVGEALDAARAERDTARAELAAIRQRLGLADDASLLDAIALLQVRASTDAVGMQHRLDAALDRERQALARAEQAEKEVGTLTMERDGARRAYEQLVAEKEAMRQEIVRLQGARQAGNVAGLPEGWEANDTAETLEPSWSRPGYGRVELQHRTPTRYRGEEWTVEAALGGIESLEEATSIAYHLAAALNAACNPTPATAIDVASETEQRPVEAPVEPSSDLLDLAGRVAALQEALGRHHRGGSRSYLLVGGEWRRQIDVWKLVALPRLPELTEADRPALVAWEAALSELLRALEAGEAPPVDPRPLEDRLAEVETLSDEDLVGTYTALTGRKFYPRWTRAQCQSVLRDAIRDAARGW